jgi:O-antigen/teichoic acid export membrane protein
LLLEKRLNFGKILTALLERGFFRNVAVLASGSALAQLVSVIGAPVLSRLYQPQDYGALSIYSSIIGLYVVIVALRYELAIPLPEDDSMAVNLLALSLVLLIILSVVFGVTLLIFADTIAIWAKTPSIASYSWLISLGLIGSGFYQVVSMWTIRRKSFASMSRTRINQSGIAFFIQCMLGLKGFGSIGLILGDILGRFGGNITLFSLIIRDDRALLKQVSVSNIKSAIIKYRKFPLLSGGSSILNSASLQLPPILIAVFYGPQVVGHYSLSQRVIGAPIMLIGLSISQVYLSEASRIILKDPAELQRLFKRIASKLFFASIIPTLILIVGAPSLFDFVFSSKWHISGQYTQVFAIMMMAQFIAIPLSTTLTVLERLDLQLIWETARLLLSLGGLVLGSILGWSAYMSIALYSTVMMLAYLALVVISGIAIQNRVNEH